MDDNLKELAKVIEGAVTELYKDAVSPSIQPIGTMLSYLPRTIRLAFNRREKWIINGEESLKLTGDLLRERIKEIPEYKLCEPEPYIAIPAIQQLSYCENSDVLRELYANLLASSMNTDTKWNVHPSFVDIIKQLNPDEAKLLKSLLPHTFASHPLLNIKYVHKKNIMHFTAISNFTNVGFDVIENKCNICSYIENIERLKIIEIPTLDPLADKTYESLKENSVLKKLIENVNASGNWLDMFEIRYEYQSFNLTNFGVNFIKISCN